MPRNTGVADVVGGLVTCGYRSSTVVVGSNGNLLSGRSRAAEDEMQLRLPFWQRLLLTIVAMLVASGLAGVLWRSLFSFPLPGFVAGMVGGLAALPCWEFLKRVRPKQGV